MLKVALATLLSVSMLAACGGGSGPKLASMPQQPNQPGVDPNDNGATDPVDRLAFVPDNVGHYRRDGIEIRPGDARHMPVYLDDNRIAVGADQRPQHLRALNAVQNYEDADMYYGELEDANDRRSMISYLTFEGGSDRQLDVVYPWSVSPRLKVIGAASDENLQKAFAAVQLVNMALPDGSKIEIDGPEPNESLRGADILTEQGRSELHGKFELEDNSIYLEFLPCSEYIHGCGDGSAGNAQGFIRESNMAQVHYIEMNLQYADARSPTGTDQFMGTLLHELLHAMGHRGHVSVDFASLLTPGAYDRQENDLLSLLFPADREALQALYTLGFGDDPSSLGPWASSSLHFAGNIPHANFGVALRNGYAESWAHGNLPDSSLAENRSLSGNAAWTGHLLGLTPEAEAVAGDARIGVSLASMTGQADFTNLEAWGANVEPGAAGTGATWLDGDLGYSIAVRGNTFRETGGDDGRLTGIFTGRSHGGAAGTLERADLTAAFGASR